MERNLRKNTAFWQNFGAEIEVTWKNCWILFSLKQAFEYALQN